MMKKVSAILLILALVLVMAPGAFAAAPKVVDDAGLLSDSQRESLEQKAEELAETYGKRDADGQLAVRGGTVEFDTQKALDEFRKARQELNETPAQTEFKPVQAPAPAMITPAQLEALEGFIEFEEGRTWDCRG